MSRGSVSLFISRPLPLYLNLDRGLEQKKTAPWAVTKSNKRYDLLQLVPVLLLQCLNPFPCRSLTVKLAVS